MNVLEIELPELRMLVIQHLLVLVPSCHVSGPPYFLSIQLTFTRNKKGHLKYTVPSLPVTPDDLHPDVNMVRDGNAPRAVAHSCCLFFLFSPMNVILPQQ